MKKHFFITAFVIMSATQLSAGSNSNSLDILAQEASTLLYYQKGVDAGKRYYRLEELAIAGELSKANNPKLLKKLHSEPKSSPFPPKEAYNMGSYKNSMSILRGNGPLTPRCKKYQMGKKEK